MMIIKTLNNTGGLMQKVGLQPAHNNFMSGAKSASWSQDQDGVTFLQHSSCISLLQSPAPCSNDL